MPGKRRLRNRLQSTLGVITGLGAAAGSPVDEATWMGAGAVGGAASSALSGNEEGEAPRNPERAERAERRAARRAHRRG